MLNRIIVLFFLAGSLAMAQSSSGSTLSTEKLLQEDIQNKVINEQAMKAESFIYGNIIKPELYYLGPGDILSFQNFSVYTNLEYIAVTPENTLFIPRIGMISVTGLTLAQVKDTIIRRCTERSKNASVFISLFKPRAVLVNITGNVLFPGTYIFPATFQVSTAISMANQFNNKESMTIPQVSGIMNYTEKQKERLKTYSNTGMATTSSYSSRNVKVIHNDGTSNIADIEKAAAYGDAHFDPYIRERDEIFVPFSPENNSMISISGAVVRPSVVTFKDGDRASMLLKLGFGLTDVADKENIYLVIPGDIGDNKKIKLTLNEDMTIQGEDYELTPGSSIVINYRKEIKTVKQGVVSVIGNINNEGIYLIDNNVTRLSEIINTSGGFTKNAYLPLAYIIRREQKDYSINDPRKQFNEEFVNSNLTMEDTARYQMQINLRRPYVSCDFNALFNNNDKSQDVTLLDGDVIYVPSNPKTVYVYGQVKVPGYIEFSEGKTMDYYIAKAGGYTSNADQERARIVKGRFKTWIEGDEETFLFAGDEIYVPSPADLPPSIEIQKYAAYAGLAAAAATIINILYIIYKNW